MYAYYLKLEHPAPSNDEDSISNMFFSPYDYILLRMTYKNYIAYIQCVSKMQPNFILLNRMRGKTYAPDKQPALTYLGLSNAEISLKRIYYILQKQLVAPFAQCIVRNILSLPLAITYRQW